VVPSYRIGGNGHKMEKRRLLLNIKEHFLTAGETKYWHELLREAFSRISQSNWSLITG